MKRLSGYLVLTVFVVLSAARSSSAQSQQQPSSPPSQPSSSGGSRSTSSQPSVQQNRDASPMYVEGRVITDSGQPAASPVSVKLSCGSTTIQTIRTDSKGYFRFTLGMGAQSNFDFSAADDSSPSPYGSLTPGGITGCANSSLGSLNGMSLTGWEVRISVPGYQPVTQIITDTPSLGTIDLGVMELRSTASVSPGSVSVTSLLVPNNARKEYDQGVKEMQNKHLPQAEQHFEKAVAVYDKYAAAWTDLGRVYATERQFDKAGEAYGKAIAADPKYAPPYVSLGAVKLEAKDYEGALESVGKAVEIDPSVELGIAGYIEAVANYSLDRFDVAEKNLLTAGKNLEQTLPQLHAMLADIYLRKNDTANAAAQIRTYLKLAPQGSFAVDLRGKLEEIEKSDNNGSAR